MRAQQRLPAQLRREGVLHHLDGPAGALDRNISFFGGDSPALLLGWNGDDNGGGRASVVRNLSLFRAKPNPNAGRSLLRPAPPEDAAANPHTLPSPRKGSARGLAGERKGSGTPRKGSAREVQGTAGLLRQYSEQI